ncbi:amidohydrolase [Dehalococcoidia bacterium]|nr:amidohydrolase [Dehalococcoidia bacterium]
MVTVNEVKVRVQSEIDCKGLEAVQVAKAILEDPEPGFREHRTAQRVAEKFRELGVFLEEGIAITGLRGIIDTGRPGPTVAIMGELDSHIVPGHAYANPETNAAHACGHHCQIGSMLAAAIGLLAEGVLENLSGRIALVAVPAEEYIELEFRDSLRAKGQLEFLGGKTEFIAKGALDDVDMAMMTHTITSGEDASIFIGGTNNGMIAKRITFTGKAAHAGASPHEGVNALNAANIAMSAIHAQRETYRDEDTIRVHPIITQGGASVSSVPADVRMETFVRGKTIAAVLSASEKVDRALRAGAMAVGGSVTIRTLPGYLPIQHSAAMLDLYESNAVRLVGKENVVGLGHRTGSTDMGDVSQIMPVIHPYVAASTGSSHGTDYVIEDYELAVIDAGKAMAMTVADLLANDARLAGEVKNQYHAPMTKEEYLFTLRGLFSEKTYME